MRETLKNLTRDMWNIPNALTIARLVMVPLFVWAYLAGQRMLALGIFCVASLTDCLDGYLARRLNQITNFGKLFDPLADKLLVVCAMACHAWAGVFPWAAVLIIAAKELLMVAGGALMLRRNIVVHANWYGKIATIFFMAALILGFFHGELRAWGYAVDVWLLWTAVVLALVALVQYAAGALKQLRQAPGDPTGPAA
ncbi:MAG: CDP-diacylglycerol--glycerol-3-phosphate 3-phosphatidyltransferase [Clostridia bacterium]|nr:CDP-diacylglycerol--glycerol-3-phosphate 3-phosphatidyltransferase [Clostridia bacterium]